MPLVLYMHLDAQPQHIPGCYDDLACRASACLLWAGRQLHNPRPDKVAKDALSAYTGRSIKQVRGQGAMWPCGSGLVGGPRANGVWPYTGV